EGPRELPKPGSRKMLFVQRGDVPDQKYLCSNCNNVLKKALQTLCGHRYCSACLSWIVRDLSRSEILTVTLFLCKKCMLEYFLTSVFFLTMFTFQAFGDAAINKEISELKVHCVTLGCSWSGIMKNFEVRLNLHSYLSGDRKTMKLGSQQTQINAMSLESASLCTAAKAANGSIPHSELNVNGAGKSISDLQIPGGLEINGDLEVDCFPGSSVSEDESVLQQLVREKVISELENKLHVFENIVAVLNKEVETSNLEITAFRRQSELDQNIIRGLELKVNSYDKHRLCACSQASYDGVFLWKITDVGRKLQDSVTGRTVSLYSPAFYTAKYGYKVCLRVYLNGDGTGKGTHVSLFFVVMKGDYDALLPWPFRHKVTFMLLDQNNREHIIDAFRPDLTSASFQRPVNDMNVASGCPMFLPLSKLQSPKYAYVKEDTLFLKCIIETN
uniref:TNF receptor-associated factor n=1 Tax=Buteo japonicus TaxID=224669 RepID=A0A8C0BI42_9AVES